MLKMFHYAQFNDLKQRAVKSPSTPLHLFLPPKQIKLAKNMMITNVQHTTSYWIILLKCKQDKQVK